MTQSVISIYWFSSSVWHCMEKGNMEWNA